MAILNRQQPGLAGGVPLDGTANRQAVIQDYIRRQQLGQVRTGGPLPPSIGQGGTPLQNPNDFLIPQLPTVNTGGPLPPNVLQPPTTIGTGGNTPPLVGQSGTPFQNPNDFLIPQIPNVNTGGPLPPNVVQPTTVGTGGNTPPNVTSNLTVGTGGNTPPGVMPNVNTGGNLPPSQVTLPGFNLPSLDGSRFVATPETGQLPGTEFSPANTTLGALDQILGREGTYIQNARQRGMELANSRGLMNSSIAAGASERAAIEAAQPILSQIMGLTGQREGLAFQGQQNQLNRTQGVNDALLGSQIDERRMQLGSQLGREEAVLDAQLRQNIQQDTTLQQDWLASNAFTRQFNGALSMMPIENAFQLNQSIMQFAAENPEVYTPDVISGMNNFFNANMVSILQQYFPGIYGGTQPPGGG